jgi:hypothetical protein
METLKDLQQQLKTLEAEIRETKKRLPAHSTKPPVMMDLLALEDEYDLVYAKIQSLRNKND